MSRIPEETIQQVLAATNIVDLVGRYVKLKRVGSFFVGLCPFHLEKGPSFSIHPDRNGYHCFCCGSSGSAIDFVVSHLGCSPAEALKHLAEMANIHFEEAHVPNP